MSFLILLEVVRTIYEYLVNSNHRIKLRYIIDGSILFGIRELFVGWITIKTDLILGLILVFVSIILPQTKDLKDQLCCKQQAFLLLDFQC